MDTQLLKYTAIIFVAAMAGGLLVFIRRWSDDLLHLFISFSAGIFTGTVFLHLIPEAFENEHHQETAIYMLTGFMLVFFIEKYLFLKGKEDYDHGHLITSITALVGLSVHSLIAGFGLAVGSHYEGLGTVLFFSILSHKSTAAFSLSSLFLLAKMPVKKRLLLLILFSIMTPLGALLFEPLFSNLNHDNLAPFLGLTTGTFLYVAVGEMLPEVFHTKKNKWLNFILLIIGIIIMAFLTHGH